MASHPRCHPTSVFPQMMGNRRSDEPPKTKKGLSSILDAARWNRGEPQGEMTPTSAHPAICTTHPRPLPHCPPFPFQLQTCDIPKARWTVIQVSRASGERTLVLRRRELAMVFQGLVVRSTSGVSGGCDCSCYSSPRGETRPHGSEGRPRGALSGPQCWDFQPGHPWSPSAPHPWGQSGPRARCVPGTRQQAPLLTPYPLLPSL